MDARRQVTDAERRARLGIRHRLAAATRAFEVRDVADSLVALHSTDPATVAGIEKTLYVDRTLVRILGMRRTLFVVPVELVPIVHAACTRAIAATQRRRYAALIEEGGIADDGGAWLDRVGDATMAALERRGEAFGAELSADVPELRSQVSYGEGKKWAGTTSMTTWVLTLLAADERIVRGRPRGSWLSSQYSWSPATTEPTRGLILVTRSWPFARSALYRWLLAWRYTAPLVVTKRRSTPKVSVASYRRPGSPEIGNTSSTPGCAPCSRASLSWWLSEDPPRTPV